MDSAYNGQSSALKPVASTKQSAFLEHERRHRGGSFIYHTSVQ